MKCEVLDDGMVLEGTDLPGWSNYLVSEKAFSLVNSYGQGLVVDREPEIYNYAGTRRYFYVLDVGSGKAFSPTYAPMLSGVTHYEVRTHPAYVAFKAVGEAGVASESRVTVDPATGAEVWEFTLTNATGAAREVELYAVIPFNERRGFGAHGRFEKSVNACVSHVTPFFVTEDERQAIAHLKMNLYVVCDREPADWSCAWGKVLPVEEMASRPPFLTTRKLGGQRAYADRSCGAVMVRVNVPAGGKETVRVALGAALKVEDIGAVRERIRTGAAFADALKHWERWDAGVKVSLPDKDLEKHINTFSKHQTRMACVTARWSQAPATRNWLLDWQGAAYLLPEDALQGLYAAIRSQRKNGWIPQGFKTSAFGKLVDALGKDYRDAPVWVPALARTLLEVRGDAGFLEEVVPYADGGEATVLEHMIHGMRYLAERRGAHGLVLSGDGEWNDGLNNVGRLGKGETTWLSMAFILACREIEAIGAFIGKPGVAAECKRWADEMQEAVNKNAWDGAWYVRGFTDNGEAFGVAANDEGKIYLEPQAWGPMAGAVPAERLPVVLNSVREHLQTSYGVRLMTPPYRRWHGELGRISVDQPGNKENGSCYCNGTMFWAAALYKVGFKDEALTQLQAVLPQNPANHWRTSGQHPTYIPNGYLAPEAGADVAGRGSNHNWTGTAPWMIILVVRELLGIKGTAEGVKFEPAFPSGWNEAGLETPFRGATLRVRYRRGGASGAYVGGKRLAGDELRGIEKGKAYEVEVRV